MNDTMRTIENRRSCRKYKDEQISKEDLETILHAGLCAPSAINKQSWHFSVLQNKEKLDDLNDNLKQLVQNKKERSKRFEDQDFHVFYHAPTVIFISGDKTFHWSEVDAGIAVQNMALCAQSLNLGSVILGMPKDLFEGTDKEIFEQLLDFPKTHAFIIAIAIGYKDDDKQMHPILENRVSYIS